MIKPFRPDGSACLVGIAAEVYRYSSSPTIALPHLPESPPCSRPEGFNRQFDVQREASPYGVSMTDAQFVDTALGGLFLFFIFALPQLFFGRLTRRAGMITAYFSMLFAAVLLPLGGKPSQGVQLVPFRWVADSLRDGMIAFEGMALNILLFVPLGFFAKVLWRRGRTEAVALGFVVSLAIEVTQLVMGHRLFDVDDLISNTTGALVGYGLAAMVGAVARSAALSDSSALARTIHLLRSDDRQRVEATVASGWSRPTRPRQNPDDAVAPQTANGGDGFSRRVALPEPISR